MEQLPNELKDLIWGLLTPRRRLIRIRAIDTERDVLSPPFVWRSTIPAVFHICPASRNKALNLYPFEEHFANCKPEFEAGPRWKRLARPALASFEKNNDILVISWSNISRFTKNENSLLPSLSPNKIRTLAIDCTYEWTKQLDRRIILQAIRAFRTLQELLLIGLSSKRDCTI